MAHVKWSLALVAFMAATIASAQNHSVLDTTVGAIEKALPAGWALAEKKSNEFPWGHHWCDDYAGPKGIQVIAVGPKAVSVQLKMKDGTSQSFPVARESLGLWVMPPEYRDSWKAWLCFSRPIQPTAVAVLPTVRIYGRPAHRLNSEEEFKELLATAQAVSWPESPWNNPAGFSWTTWVRDIEAAAKVVK